MLINLSTMTRVTLATANQQLAGKTRLTANTTDAALKAWGYAREIETESPGDDYELADPVENDDGDYEQVWQAITYDIDVLRDTAATKINDYYQDSVISQCGEYPDYEQDTWTDQKTEATAYTAWVYAAGSDADSQPETPTLDAIASARGITTAELASKVITKATAWSTAALAAAGERQAKIDQLYSDDCSTKAAIDELVDGLGTESD